MSQNVCKKESLNLAFVCKLCKKALIARHLAKSTRMLARLIKLDGSLDLKFIAEQEAMLSSTLGNVQDTELFWSMVWLK